MGRDLLAVGAFVSALEHEAHGGSVREYCGGSKWVVNELVCEKVGLEAGLLPSFVCQDILHANLIRSPWLPVARVVETHASPKDVRPAVRRCDLIHCLAEIEPGPAIAEIPVVARPCARGKPIDGECR